MNDRELEKYLFMICEKTLEFFEVKYEKEELADLVMMNLLNIKVPK